MAIDARPQVVPTDELLIQLQQFKANKDYTFITHFSNLDASTTPFLLDTYLNQYTALANNAATEVAFTTTTNVLSHAPNRFKIVFQNNTLTQPDIDAALMVIYPNPVTNNQFNISLPSNLTGEVSIRIINTLGQIVYGTTTAAQHAISITPRSVLAQGVYLVELTHEGKSTTEK